MNGERMTAIVGTIRHARIALCTAIESAHSRNLKHHVYLNDDDCILFCGMN